MPRKNYILYFKNPKATCCWVRDPSPRCAINQSTGAHSNQVCSQDDTSYLHVHYKPLSCSNKLHRFFPWVWWSVWSASIAVDMIWASLLLARPQANYLRATVELHRGTGIVQSLFLFNKEYTVSVREDFHDLNVKLQINYLPFCFNEVLNNLFSQSCQ